MEEKKLVRQRGDSLTDFPGNTEGSTKKSRIKPVDDVEETRKKKDSVVKGNVEKRQKSLGQKFSETFLGDDAHSVRDYIVYDILIPALKNTVSEAITGGIELALFGEPRGRDVRRDGRKSYVSYSSAYNKSSSRDRGRDDRRSRARHDFGDVIFESRVEAEEVLSHLSDLVIDYGFATVADFYDLCGLDSQFTDTNYGWDELRGAHTDRVRNGYAIRLPKTRPLD